MTIPDPIAELLDLGQQNLQGIKKIGASLGILQYTEATFGPVVAGLETRQDAFNAARSATAAASALAQLQVAAMRKAVSDARHVLCISWGEAWSPQWAQAGWNDNSTAVPKAIADLAALCAGIGAFLGDAANAGYVVSTAKIDFTAARYSGFVGETGTYTLAESALATARVTQGQMRDNRGGSATALRAAVHGLLGLLTGILSPLDPRWDDFGLPRPGVKTHPGQALGLALSRSGTTAVTVLARCDQTPDTTYWRWFGKLEGVDGQFRFLGRTREPLFELTGQPAAGELEMRVEAANEAGPGKASVVVGIALG